MTSQRGREHRTLEVAERVYETLMGLGAEAAVIGAMALAAHGYVRATRDFDLATHVDPFVKLPEVKRIERLGFKVEVRQPDADDPLKGVVEVKGPGFKPIQIVNFLNPLATTGNLLGKEAIEVAQAGLIEKSSMRVITLPHLVALKLYAGGARSRNDVIELLERNQPLNLRLIRDVCRRHGLGEDLEDIVSALGL